MGKWEAVTGAEPWGFGPAAVVCNLSALRGAWGKKREKENGLEEVCLLFTFSSHLLFLSSGTNSYMCVGGGVG